jgi:hypothetical protein
MKIINKITDLAYSGGNRLFRNQDSRRFIPSSATSPLLMIQSFLFIKHLTNPKGSIRLKKHSMISSFFNRPEVLFLNQFIDYYKK